MLGVAAYCSFPAFTFRAPLILHQFHAPCVRIVFSTSNYTVTGLYRLLVTSPGAIKQVAALLVWCVRLFIRNRAVIRLGKILRKMLMLLLSNLSNESILPQPMLGAFLIAFFDPGHPRCCVIACLALLPRSCGGPFLCLFAVLLPCAPLTPRSLPCVCVALSKPDRPLSRLHRSLVLPTANRTAIRRTPA